MAYLGEVCSDPLQWSSETASGARPHWLGALPSTVTPFMDWGGQSQQNTSFLNMDLNSGTQHISLGLMRVSLFLRIRALCAVKILKFGTKSMGSGTMLSKVKYWLFHWPAVWLWSMALTSLFFFPSIKWKSEWLLRGLTCLGLLGSAWKMSCYYYKNGEKSSFTDGH